VENSRLLQDVLLTVEHIKANKRELGSTTTPDFIP